MYLQFKIILLRYIGLITSTKFHVVTVNLKLEFILTFSHLFQVLKRFGQTYQDGLKDAAWRKMSSMAGLLTGIRVAACLGELMS